ncbi:hypothetical protein HWV62_34459 [Athelia sp. TMB]|nr:hypothetical protein HWV62_34459 [Athelia sp. TMB]
MSGMPRSEWNKSCARVFARSFVEEHKNDPADWSLDPKTVGECWLTHFKALQKTHKEQCGSQQTKEARLRRKRRAFRKEQLYQRRLRAGATLTSQFGVDAQQVVQNLGMDGMSSDESDHETGAGEATYFLTSKKWRAVEVTQYLHDLDAWHLYERYGHQYQASAGAWPHFRSPDQQQISTREPVNQLPSNFYNLAWWKNITTFERGVVNPSKAKFNLHLPPAVKERIQGYDIGNRSTMRGLRGAQI